MSKRREGEILEADETDVKPGNGEAEAEPAGLEAVETLETLRSECEGLKRERDELKDQVLRRRADFENYRKRVERDRELAMIEAKAQALSALLPTIDNFERALEAPADPG